MYQTGMGTHDGGTVMINLVTLNRIPYFSGVRAVAARVAQKMGIPTEEFRFIEPIPHRLYGVEKGTVTLYWCGKPDVALISHHRDFYQHLKVYEASVIYVS